MATPDAVLRSLGTNRSVGLTEHEAARRLEVGGLNVLSPSEPVPAWRKLLAHFADPVVYLLLAAIVISGGAWLTEGAHGLPLDTIVIAAIVVINAVMGFVQEHRAEAAVAALRDLTQAEATVFRDGSPRRINAAELVVGDLIDLAGGDVVPADARLIESNVLQVAEAALTGESMPAAKSPEALVANAALGDRTPMVYSGTAVSSGRARAVITATGDVSEVGHIAALLTETESESTPLQDEIRFVGRVLGLAVIVIAVLVVAMLLLTAEDRTTAGVIDALLIGVSLAVAAVPEGLPAVLTVVLALGVQRMSTRNALIKRLASVETLGSSTIICSDKTGTLTRNEMTVRRLVLPSANLELTGSDHGTGGGVLHDGLPLEDRAIVDDARWALTVGRLASDASLAPAAGQRLAIGDPTEAALFAALPKVGVDDALIGHRYRRIGEAPFTPERKMMSTVIVDAERADETILTAKGAPDFLLDHCRSERVGDRIVPLTSARAAWWLETSATLAGQAFRTLAIAYRHLDGVEQQNDPVESMEDDLVLLGVVGIIDPPRTEAKRAIEQAARAGVRVAMITGDHPETARRIAMELGIADPADRVITSSDLSTYDDEELAELAASTTVYARVAPEQKLRIVQALRSRDEVVAMTGDGVNDAPALKAADIGIAMGLTGTDVSKEAADMILADDNFATIVTAISEGRAIFHNIRSFLRYLLSSNIGEVFTVFGGVLGAAAIGLTDDGTGGRVAPLLAVQILWINLVTDAGPALALGLDPPSAGLMERRPRRPTDRVIDRRMQGGILVVGLTMAVAALAMLDLGLPGGLLGGSGDVGTARTGSFTVLVLAQLFNTFNARSDTESARHRLLANPWLVAAVFFSLLLQVAVVHLPFLNEAFGTSPLTVTDWLIATALASSVIWVAETRKFVLRRSTPISELD